MEILSLKVHSTEGLTIQEVTFTDPTLLIGVSGSGKSQILSALHGIFSLIRGEGGCTLGDGVYDVSFREGSSKYSYQAVIRDGGLAGSSYLQDGNPLSGHLNLRAAMPFVDFLGQVSQVRQSGYLLEKTWLATEKQQEEIKDLFRFIFPSVEAMVFFPEDILVREAGLEGISYKKLSDGMLKALLYICELVTCQPGTVILIDEFENGLGLNCLSVLLEEMLDRDDVQVIMSSHHPYVINNVPTAFWQVISRDRDQVGACSASALGIGQTRYDAFFELMNILSYGEEF